MMKANAGHAEIDNPNDWVLLKAFDLAVQNRDFPALA
jgi:hypothetical protein